MLVFPTPNICVIIAFPSQSKTNSRLNCIKWIRHNLPRTLKLFASKVLLTVTMCLCAHGKKKVGKALELETKPTSGCHIIMSSSEVMF